MGNESRNREDGIMYGAPCTYGEMEKHTNEVKGEQNSIGFNEDSIGFNEDSIVYIPEKGATYEQIIGYTASVKEQIATTLK